MRQQRKQPSTRRKAIAADKISIPKESIKLLEYIESLGITRSGFNLLRSSESRLKVGPPALFHL